MAEVNEEISDAACYGDRDTLVKFMEFGHRFVMDPFNTEHNALELAIIYGHYECVEILLEYSDSHTEIDMCGDGPVVVALSSPNLDILRLLLQKGFSPWGNNGVTAINLIEWGFLYDALQIYMECGVSFCSMRLLRMGCFNIMGYLMRRGYDPTEELFKREHGLDWWGSRARLFKFIYVSCYNPDPYNRTMLSMLTDHHEVGMGGGLIEFDTNDRALRVLLDAIRDKKLEGYDFLWAQE